MLLERQCIPGKITKKFNTASIVQSAKSNRKTGQLKKNEGWWGLF